MKKDFFKEYALPIIAVVIFLLAFIWLGTRVTIESNSNSVEDWLPDYYQETRDYRWFLDHFPFESFVVVSWKDCTLADSERIEFFAQKLVPEQTIDNFSLMAPSTEIEATLNLEKAPSLINVDKIQEQRRIEKRLEAEKIQSEQDKLQPQEKQTAGKPAEKKSEAPKADDERTPFKTVMTGPRLLRLLEQSYSRLPGSARAEELRTELINRLKGTLIGPDGKSTAVIVTLEKGNRNGKEMKKVLDKIRALSVECGLPDTVQINGGTGLQRIGRALYEFYQETVYGRIPNLNGLIMGGPPTDNVALDQEGERTLYRLAGICALIGLTLSIICLRSIRLTMFVFWVALLSAGISMALVSATGGTCDAILLSMPALVYIIAMSGSIHLVNYYHDAIKENGLAHAAERSVKHAFKPTFFAQFTTAIGLGSLYASHLTPIVKFGFYSAIGVLITLLLMFLYLPALLYFYPSKKFAELYGGKGDAAADGWITRVWTKIGSFNIRHHTLTLVILLAVMIFLGLQLKSMKVSVKMMNFFSPDADIIANYTWLEEKLGPLVPMELVIAFDNNRLPQSVFDTTERLRLVNRISDSLKKDLHEDVGGTLSVGLFTPDIDAILNTDPASPPERNNFRYTAVSSVIEKTINNNRSNLKDYLTIEGNPTIDELHQYFKEKCAGREKDLTEQKDQLNIKMKEKGFSLAETIEQIGRDPAEERKTAGSGPNVKPNPFISDVKNLMKSQTELAELQEINLAFQESRTLLASSKINCLKDMNTFVSKEHPFLTLSLKQTQLLHKAVSLWQQEKGIDLWRISIRVWALKKDIDYSKFINDVKKVVEPIMAQTNEKLQQTIISAGGVLSEMEEPEEFHRDNTKLSPEEIKGRNRSMGITHSTDIVYPSGISAKYTGMVPLVYKTQHELINGLTQSLLWAFVLIAVVVIFIYKDWSVVFVAMPSNIFPVVVVFGYMAWRGILVDVGTMMTASVALGVAVDDTIHYLTWFNDSIDRGDDIDEAARKAYRRCAAAMLESSIISGLGLFAFAFSTFVPTQRFGIMMLAILWAAVMGDLLMLPAILTSPIGKFYVNRRRRKSLNRQKQLETES